MKKLFKKNGKKGFTLAEVLIVIAIIAILLGIAIPVFTTQTEKAHEAVDASAIRNAYATLMTNSVSGGETTDITLNLEQTKEGWTDTALKEGLEKVMTLSGALTNGSTNKCTLSFDSSTSKVTCTFNK